MPASVTFQIRLRTLLLAFVPLAIACFFVHDYVHHRPLHWERYEGRNLQGELSEGRPVIIYVKGAITCGTGDLVPLPCRDDRVIQYARARGIKTLRAGYGHTLPGRDPNTGDLLLVYSPVSPQTPSHVDWIASHAVDDLLAAISEATDGHSSRQPLPNIFGKDKQAEKNSEGDDGTR